MWHSHISCRAYFCGWDGGEGGRLWVTRVWRSSRSFISFYFFWRGVEGRGKGMWGPWRNSNSFRVCLQMCVLCLFMCSYLCVSVSVWVFLYYSRIFESNVFMAICRIHVLRRGSVLLAFQPPSGLTLKSRKKLNHTIEIQTITYVVLFYRSNTSYHTIHATL